MGTAFGRISRFSVCSWVCCLCLGPAARAQHLLVGSVNNGDVLRFDAATGANLGLFIANGTGGLNSSEQMAFTQDGSLLISGYGSGRVLRFDGSTGVFQSVFANIFAPTGLAVRGNEVFVSSFSSSGFVNRYNATTGGFLGAFVGAGSGGLGSAHGVVFGPNGNLFVSDNSNDRVLQYDGVTGNFIGVAASGGGLDGPTGLVFGPDGRLFVASDLNSKIAMFDGVSGSSLGDFVPSGSGGLTDPHDLAFRSDGLMYVVGGSSIRRYDGVTGNYFDEFASSPLLIRASYFVFTPTPVPEPSTLLQMGATALLMFVLRFRRMLPVFQGWLFSIFRV
jgi:hypothetical protein